VGPESGLHNSTLRKRKPPPRFGREIVPAC
jgi:hypothetical protein